MTTPRKTEEIQIFGMTLEEIRILKQWRDGNPHIKRTMELMAENTDLRYSLHEARKHLSSMAYHLGVVVEENP